MTVVFVDANLDPAKLVSKFRLSFFNHSFGDDARDLLPHLERIALVEVNFPVYGDGRGYSAARVLREEGYAGEIRAVGDVLVDQLNNMRRCGFDAFQPDVPMNEADAQAALDTWPEVYQATTDGRNPIWNLRHE